MRTTTRTDSADAGFVALVQQLDADLAARDGQEHSFYAPFNKIDGIRHAIIIQENGVAVSCGAMKPFDELSMEVKRMFTVPQSRGQGLATTVLGELETWAAELGFERCVLETGKRQPEAIELYQKNGYRIIENYGQYAGVENSVCFEKKLTR